MIDEATPDQYALHSHPPGCKWVPGWWDPICKVCQQTRSELAASALSPGDRIRRHGTGWLATVVSVEGSKIMLQMDAHDRSTGPYDALGWERIEGE